MEQRKWLTLSYNLPTEPSRYRVAAWRALKKLGAVNFQQSLWILPYKEENDTALKKIAAEIEDNGGEAFLLESFFTLEKYEEKIIATFNTICNEEYLEFINECEKYLKELDKEITIEKFTFAELEEEEAELEKLTSWHRKIEARDLFQASEGEAARTKHGQIVKAFDQYSDLVFQQNEKIR